MFLGGIQKFSLIDYPGKIVATIFTVGCNFRCPFCHNPELVLPEQVENQPLFSEEKFFSFLAKNKKLLDGICITGGEPTVQNDLIDFIRRIKKEGYLVKLDSNGSKPEILKELLENNLVDYLAMDIKTSPQKYSLAAGREIKMDKIKESADLVRQFPNYEFRTTIVPKIVTEDDILNICQWLSGSKLYVLQQYHSDKTIDPTYENLSPYPDDVLIKMKEIAQPFFDKIEIRGIIS